MNKTVKFGIVGCGVIADIHAQGLMNTAEAQLYAVCDQDVDKGMQFATKYGAKFYDSYEKLLADEVIQVVNICTPSGLHPEQTIAAARAKKHVMCEKPIGIDMESVYRMIAICREEGVMLSTIFPRRVGPAAQYLKQCIQQGKLGRITLADAVMKIHRSQQYYDSAGWRGTWEMDGGGAMMNQGIHLVDLLQWLVGGVSTVYGKAAALQRNIEVEDTAIAMLQLKNGGYGLLEMTTTVNPDLGQRIEIHGDRGSAILTEDQLTGLNIDGTAVEIPQFAPFHVLPDGHRLQIQDMAQAVLEGRMPSITGEDGVAAIEIILATYQSSKLGSVVELSDEMAGESK